LRFKTDILTEYLCMAPFALAIERSIEGNIYKKMRLEKPILDLGCGEGLFAHIVFDEKIDTGIDPNSKELFRAKELGAYQELIHCYGDSIPRPDSSYMTVISNSVLEHIPDLSPVFKEIFRILHPGGYLIFTVPTQLFEQFSAVSRILRSFGFISLALRYEHSYNKFWNQTNCFSPDLWKKTVESHGFEVVEIFSYDPKNVCTLNDLFVPFSVFSYIIKNITNRWILFPSLRKIWVSWLTPSISKMLIGADRSPEGGLVFISARKKVPVENINHSSNLQ
jgi:SAM-dependent methyltransferase